LTISTEGVCKGINLYMSIDGIIRCEGNWPR